MTNNAEITLHLITLRLFLLGLTLIFIGSILDIIARTLSNASTTFGGITITGPFPIIFGLGENIFSTILIVLTLAIACIIFFILNTKTEANKSI